MKKFNPLSSIYFYAGAKGRPTANLIAAAETRVSSEATRPKNPDRGWLSRAIKSFRIERANV